MKRNLKKLIFSACLLQTTLFGGGDFIPVIIPVVTPDDTVSHFSIGVGVIWGLESLDCALECGGREKDNSFGGIIKGEYEINNYFGIEARALHDGLGNNFAETTHYGLYLKPKYPIIFNTNIYALLGYGHTEVKDSVSNFNHKKDGFSYGAGIEHKFVQSDWSIWGDYMNLMYHYDDFRVNSNVLSVGVSYPF